MRTAITQMAVQQSWASTSTVIFQAFYSAESAWFYPKVEAAEQELFVLSTQY